ncbi:hypothetical protein [Rickettsia felis]|uniref:hypothetical protein n=1 Tax=Rickettsia felis TaxID=42862 RepID=UPI001F3CAA9A|nr:hypothetical protein [Rickettsia felis]
MRAGIVAWTGKCSLCHSSNGGNPENDCHPVARPIVPDNFYYMSFPRRRESSKVKLLKKSFTLKKTM